MSSTTQSVPQGDVQLVIIFRAIGKSAATVALLVLVAALVTYVGLGFVTPQYTSVAQVLIDGEPDSYRLPAESRSSVRVRPPGKATIQTHALILKSRELASTVIRSLRLDSNPEFKSRDASQNLSFWNSLLSSGARIFNEGSKSTDSAAHHERLVDRFLKRLDVAQVDNSHVISIAFTSRSPKTAAAAVNALVDSYLSWLKRRKLDQITQASGWLKAQIKILRERAAAAEAKAERFRSNFGLLKGTEDSELYVQELTTLNTKIAAASARKLAAMARADHFKAVVDNGGNIAASADVLNSQIVQRLLEQRGTVHSSLAALSQSLMPSHPRMVELRSHLASLNEQIKQESRKTLSSLQDEAQVAEQNEMALQRELDALKRSASKHNGSQISLRALEREAASVKTLLESYLARYRDATSRHDDTSVPTTARIVTRGHESNAPSSPRTILITLIVLCSTGALGVAASVARVLISSQSNGGQALQYQAYSRHL